MEQITGLRNAFFNARNRETSRLSPGFRRCAAAGLIWAVGTLAVAGALWAQSLEYQVKAAFLLNFIKFVEWQPETALAPAPFDICIFGEDPFGPALEQIVAGETIHGRAIRILHVPRPIPASCSELFVSRSEKNVTSLVESLGPGVLTVGEGENFLESGGIIAFVVENRRVRFDISQAAAARARLVISSRLLSVARQVER